MAEFFSIGNPSLFNEDAKFYKDVYIFGKLHYDFENNGVITFGDIIVNGNSSFTSSANFSGPVNIDNLLVGIATVTKRLDVGIGGTILTTSTGKVGLGNPNPTQLLDVAGNIKIDNYIFDSINNAGQIGYYLSRDVSGIRWVEVAPGANGDINVYNSGVQLGTGQAFQGLNLLTGSNTSGTVTDSIQAFVNPVNDFIADIYVYDYWSLNGSSIYRNTNVGIKSSIPRVELDIIGSSIISNSLNVGGISTFNSSLDVVGQTILYSTLYVSENTVLNSSLDVNGNTDLDGTLDVLGTAILRNNLLVSGIATVSSNLNVDGNTDLDGTLDVALQGLFRNDLATYGNLRVDGNADLNYTLNVGVGGTVIKTTGSGSIGFGSVSPQREIDVSKNIIFKRSVYDSYNQNTYEKDTYQVPRAVLTTVGVNTTGDIIPGRFYDAANLIRLNLDYIAAESVGFITSTSYRNPPFTLSNSNYNSCKDDIKDILKSITYDITRGGNSKSVGAGLSYYNGNSLIHITGTDVNGYSIKEASVAAISSAAQISRYVINNSTPPISYQSGISSVKQVKDLTLENDGNSNINPNGCSNVVSAIYSCAGIITAIINKGPSAAPSITYPGGKVVWAPAGADSKNTIWVTKYGSDENTGKTEGDAKLTIGAAAEIAMPGDTIFVRPGVYFENNPIGLRTDVAISGQDLRLVNVVPLNLGKDMFQVRRGCLIENLSFLCEQNQKNTGGAAVAFPPTAAAISTGEAFAPRTGYLAPGPATEGSSGRWRSPYVRNCTNFMPESIGMKVDGRFATGSTIGADLKCMVLDAFTQYNENGIGVSITNSGYAQLVSLFTICCDKAVYVTSGGQCDLTNSNSSFGNYGLYADGLGVLEFTATVAQESESESDIFVFNNVRDQSNTIRRPYDGQALYFKVPVNGTPITAPLRLLDTVTVTNGGSGYSAASPPNIIIRDVDGTVEPKGPEGIIAEVSPTINDAGQITSIDVINNGRNYLSTQNIIVEIEGNGGASAVANMAPIYYTVASASAPTVTTGISTVVLNEFVPYLIPANTQIEMFRISRILTSGHSFEYIGTGTDINTSTPQKGAVPIKDNEVVAINGAQVPYTSTDQQGNFNIGDGIQINQTTSSITGRDFNRAIQAQVTPLILALR
jgi:hypothetical protein